MSPLDLIRRRRTPAVPPTAAPTGSAAPGPGAPQPTIAERVVARTAGLLGGTSSRRRFLTRTAVVGSALAVNPVSFIFKPGTAYGAVCGTCSDGWTAFCCTVNGGRNSCPPNTFVAGWWKADNAAYCGGSARYIIDCNATCPTRCSCRCAGAACDGRRACCNQFRYGQCNQHISCYGPVACRVAICITPWAYDAACSTRALTDNRTVQHGAACLKTEHNTAITRKYYALGGPDGFLGILSQTERATPDNRGRYATYQGGRIYSSAATGAHEVHGSIFDVWAAAGSTSGTYGFPASDTGTLPGGTRWSRFQKGHIYRHLGGTFGVPEPHLGVYLAYGGHNTNSALGLPTSGLIRSADNVAVYINFQRGRTYHRGSRAVEIHGAIFDKHEEHGGVHGPLGHVATSVTTLSDGHGRASTFDGGAIYYTGSTGAHAIWGALITPYLDHGGPTSDLGYPTTDRGPVGDGRGHRVLLQSGGIYYTSTTGAHVVPGRLHDLYADRGGPTGSLGYPVAAAEPGIGGAYSQRFEDGTLSIESRVVPFVQAAFADFVDRAPNSNELAWHANAIYGGAKSRADLVRELAFSDEYLSTLVNRFYQDTLGRPGGSGEVAYWVGRLRGGFSVAQTAASFYASPEYFDGIGGGNNADWVTDLFQKILGRTPNQADRDYWVDEAVARGRGNVAHRMYQSAESCGDRVRALYQALLGRTPIQRDVDFWVPRVRSQGDLTLAVTLASMQEYYDRAQSRF